MQDNERLQAAKAAFTLCQEEIARQYGVVAFANANSQQLQGGGGIQIQLNPYIDFAFVAGWQPESTVGGKNGVVLDGKWHFGTIETRQLLAELVNEGKVEAEWQGDSYRAFPVGGKKEGSKDAIDS